MRYKAGQLKTGKWAVLTGKKYFTDTICDSEGGAVIRSCELSAQWHQRKMDRCRSEWEEAHRKNGKKEHYEEGATGENIKEFDKDWDNVLC